MTERNDAFDNWTYRTVNEKTGMPLLTHLLYEVCEDNAEKFEKACEMLQLAFEGGQKYASGEKGGALQ